MAGMLAVLAAVTLHSTGAAKNAVSYDQLCFLSLALEGTVLLPNATCCRGKVEEMGTCPELYGGWAATAEDYLLECDRFPPAATIVAKSARDVRRAVVYLKYANVEFRVKGGGHSQGCQSTVANGVVLSVREMQKTEYVESGGDTFIGVESGRVLAEVYADYMANSTVYFPHGIDPPVGLGGHIAGGGVGPLSRKFGFALDWVVGVEMVLPSGQWIRAFDPGYEQRITGRRTFWPGRYADLLWAVRGNGHGNFGVVTKYWVKTIQRPAFSVRAVWKYAIDSPAVLENAWTAPCAFYGAEESVLDRGLMAWPQIRPDGLLFDMSYLPNANATAEEALAEAQGVIDRFLAPIVGTPYSTSLVALNDTEQLGGFLGAERAGAFGRTGLTCVSRMIESRSDVCENPDWIRRFTQYMFTEYQMFMARGSAFFSYFDPWGGAISDMDAAFEKTSMSTRNAWGTLQYCRDPIPFLTQNYDDLILAPGGTHDFNNTLMAEVGTASYMNFQDNLITERSQIYPDPDIYRRLQDIKKKYDPKNLFDHPFGIELP